MLQQQQVTSVITLIRMGYALPGSVLAVGVMLSLTFVDKQFVSPLFHWLGMEAPLISASISALLFAYLVRFIAVAYGPIDASFEKMTPRMAEAGRSLGCHPRQLITRIYIPLLKPGLLSALLLVMVDVMKEMPATLLLRPFGWDTLAVKIFEFTSEGEWERAALPAVTLVALGLIPVILLVKKSSR